MKSFKIKCCQLLPILVLGFLITVCSSCRHEPILMEGTPTVCFQDQILPIIKSNCAMAGCHDAGSDEGPTLTNYENISDYGYLENLTKANSLK